MAELEEAAEEEEVVLGWPEGREGLPRRCCCFCWRPPRPLLPPPVAPTGYRHPLSKSGRRHPSVASRTLEE